MKKAAFYGLFGLCLLGALACPHMAHAAAAGGTMPWDKGFTNLREDLTGPFAYTVTILLICISGFAWHRSDGEMNGIVRGLIGLVFVGSLLMLSTQVATAFGWTGAVVA